MKKWGHTHFFWSKINWIWWCVWKLKINSIASDLGLCNLRHRTRVSFPVPALPQQGLPLGARSWRRCSGPTLDSPSESLQVRFLRWFICSLEPENQDCPEPQYLCASLITRVLVAELFVSRKSGKQPKCMNKKMEQFWPILRWQTTEQVKRVNLICSISGELLGKTNKQTMKISCQKMKDAIYEF